MTDIMSISGQVASIQPDWSQFKVRTQTDDTVIWRGAMEAEHQTFTVEIKFTQGDTFPWVSVLRPAWRERPDFKDGPLPHVYWRDNKPFLCLFDPAQRNGTPAWRSTAAREIHIKGHQATITFFLSDLTEHPPRITTEQLQHLLLK